MIPSMRIIRQLFCLLILYLSVPGSLTAQNSVPLTWEWKKVPDKQDTLQAAAGDKIKITIAKIPDSGSIAEFFHKTVVTVVKKGIKDSLYKRIVNARDKKTADSVIKSHGSKKEITSFLLSDYLGKIEPGDTIIIKPFLGPGVDINNSKSIKKVFIDTAAVQTVQPNPGAGKPGEANTVFSPKPVGSWWFIPLATMEADWAAKFACCEFLTAPKMNKHTRWAITYDYNTGDPVAVWRRGNKTPADGGCCEVVSEEGRKKNKGKNKKEDTTIAVKIALQAAALEKEWLALEKVVKDTVLRQRAVGVRTSIAGLYGSLKSAMTDAEHKAALARLQEIKDQIDIIRAMNGALPALHRHVPLEKGCCSEVYCGRQAKRMAPTVKRSVLISVANFHPYRDSFSLAVSYDDHFGQDMALFNSTFASITGQAGAPKKDSADSKTKPLSATTVEDLKRQEGKRYVGLFDTLRQELKWYYTSKIQQVRLDPGVVENGVNYIKQRMSDVLGITDFTEAGVAKRAEEVADLVKRTDTTLESFFAIAREAGAWWDKVANYRIFDNKSVLVRNKDVMNIVLKRYTYGKLISSDEEATRSYYTSGGFKIDFSTGLFGNFITDKEYTTVNTGSSSKPDSIISNDKGKFNIGPAVYSHFYWRSGFDLNVSGTIGLAINQEALPRYLFGGSLLIGRDQRLVLTGGLACGPAKELAAGLKEGDKIQLSSFANSTLPDRDVWQNKWFVGVSWNFAGINVGK